MIAYQQVRAALRDQFPEAWAKLCPRQYHDAGDHTSPDLPAAQLGGTAASVSEGYASETTARLIALVSGALVAGGMPTYHVGRKLLAALDRTDPPEGLTWADVKLPREAGVLLFPARFATDLSGRSYGYVTWARTRTGEEFHPPIGGSYEAKNDAILFTTCSAEDPHFSGLVYSCSLAEWPHVRPHDLDRQIADDLIRFAEHEPDVIRRLAGIASNVLLLWSARPEMLEKGRLYKRTKGGSEYWTPSWIGLSYQPPTETGGGTHASPRSHWRRGHFRNQRHGPELSLSKLLWIEPTFING